MPKLLKYLFVGLGSTIALLVLVIAIIAATFNPSDYKPLIIKLVRDKTQRTLSIPGEIKLMYFPRIGADLGKVAITERNGQQVFASGEHARVSLALLPIFAKQFVVARVVVDGLTVNIHRFKDGTSNYDDLLPKGAGQAEGSTAQQVMFDIAGVSITNANLAYTDDADKRRLVVSSLNLTTGPIANGKKSSVELNAEVKGENPMLALKVKVKSNFTLDLDQKHYVLNELEAALSGAAADFSSLQLKLSAPSVEASATAFKIPSMSLDATVKQGTLNATASLTGALEGDIDAQLFRSPKLALSLDGKAVELAIKGHASTQLSANMKSRLIDLAGLSADLVLPNPAGGTLTLNANGKASVNLLSEAVQVALAGKLDGSAFDAKVGLTKFAQPAYTFDIAIDNLDADRYQAKGAQPAKAGPAGATGAETPIDLSALQSLAANGKLKVGALKFANIKASNVLLELHAGGGKVDVNPFAAALYGGSVAGSLSATASNPPRFSARQTLRNVNIGPLLKDAIASNPVDGKGDVALDITTAGATVSQLKKSLNGTARLELKDGAVNGINLAATIRHAKARIGMAQGNATPQQGTASAQEKTDFSELASSFKIANGVAHNDDFSAKSPLLRLGGNGDINIGEDRLDYTVKATVVPSLQGQGGPELQALKGLTVPVKLSGPFSAISWNIDFTGMASDLAKQQIEEKKGQVKAEAQKKIDEQKGKLQDQLQDRLKGLFGK